MADNIKVTGRIIWGHPMKPRPKTDTNNQPVIKDGKQVMQWSFGLAVPKNGPDIAAVFAAMNAEAAKGYPSGSVPQNFAWKFKDGDTALDSNGKPLRDREGYAGCFVLSIAQEFAINCYTFANGTYVAVADENVIKTGYFVQVSLSINYHAPNPNARGSAAGLYLNPSGVLLVGYGPEIQQGPDAQTMFGGAAPSLPPGASAQPVAPPGAPAMPGTGGPPAFAPPAAPGGQPAYYPTPAAGGGYPAPGALPSTMSPAVLPLTGPGGFPMPTVSPSNVAPHPTFVSNATGTQPPAPLAPPAAPAQSQVPQYPGYQHTGWNLDGSPAYMKIG